MTVYFVEKLFSGGGGGLGGYRFGAVRFSPRGPIFAPFFVTFMSRSIFHADDGRGCGDLMGSDQTGNGPFSRVSLRIFLLGVIVALGSFSLSSPHFTLNMLTAFCCSISLVRLSMPSRCRFNRFVLSMVTGALVTNIALFFTPPPPLRRV